MYISGSLSIVAWGVSLDEHFDQCMLDLISIPLFTLADVFVEHISFAVGESILLVSPHVGYVHCKA